MDAIVVKVGGSLGAYPEKLRSLCAKLTELSHRYNLIIIPGGGEFADVARKMDQRFKLSPRTSHRMAILGMDQYGLLLEDLLEVADVITDIGENMPRGNLTIFLPSAFLFKEDQLENSWDVTSDSIAVYIAKRLRIPKVLLITDVDGMYSDDPKTHPNAKLIERLGAQALLKLNKRTSVDMFLPKLLQEFWIEVVIVNGLQPERVEAVLDKKDTVCTVITFSE